MDSLEKTLFDEISAIPLVDPHSHIDPRAPAATSLVDLFGYHYYTELAHSAGLPKEEITSADGLEQCQRIVSRLVRCGNTIQVAWLLELSKVFFDFPAETLTVDNVAEQFSKVTQATSDPAWPDKVFAKTRLEAIFLTNDFDDPLSGFDRRRYVPCLRTDDLVFKLATQAVASRFEKATGIAPSSWPAVLEGLDRLFEHFVTKGARACAISLPPDFEPIRPTTTETAAALERSLRGTESTDDSRALACAVFFAIADRAGERRLPFDLMIGVNRRVYENGVHQGQDLYDQRTSLHLYRRLFNQKPEVTFPVSVLSHAQNQELVSHAWIFPNVVTCGHWWYANIPACIEPDLRARLEAVPASKQIGYYSDAYKLEFVLPKFAMYRRCLARVLAREYVQGRGWSESRAIALAKTVLRDNVESIFPSR